MREGGRGRCGSLVWAVAALVLVGALGRAIDGVAQQPVDEVVNPPPELIVLPPDEVVKLQLGERRRFSVTVADTGATYRWTLDGAVVGDAARWEFVPRPADLGSHVVTVTVLVGSTASRRRWRVSVTPAPPPTVRDAAPEGDVVQSEPGKTVSFRFMVEPGVETDTITVAWTIDGEAAGSGSHLRVEPPAEGSRRIRVVASSELGAVIVRQWELRGSTGEVAAANAEPPLGAVTPDEELLALLDQRPGSRPVPRATTSTVPPQPVTTTTQARAVVTSTTTSIPPVRVTTSTVPVPVPSTSRAAPARVVVTTSSVPVRVAVATTSPPTPRVVASSTSVPPRVVVATSSTAAPPRVAVPTSSTMAPRPVVVTTSSVPRRVVVVTTTTLPPRVAAVPPSTAPPRRPSPPSTQPPARPAPVAVASRPPDAAPVPPARTPQTAPAGITRADVEALMQRYAQAFSGQDVAELRRIGQVTDDRQADAMGRYFATVSDLQVTVRVLAVETSGTTATVRFQRRDRFRDPAGRVVDKESPPIEKSLQRTPDGLRFLPRS